MIRKTAHHYLFTICASLALLASLCLLQPAHFAQAANGDLDTTFGSPNGWVQTLGFSSDDGYDEYAEAVTVQPDGKIVVAGRYWIGTDWDSFVLRLNANGTLDTSFGTGGKVTFSVSAGENCYDYPQAVAVQPDGKIVVAGSAFMDATRHYDVFAARINPNGTFDTSFGSTGLIVFATTNLDAAEAIALQPDGKILLAGSYQPSEWYVLVMRLNTNGSLDTTFDSDGKLIFGFGGVPPCSTCRSLGYALALQTDGKIIVGGRDGDGSNGDFFLARMDSDGSNISKVKTPVSLEDTIMSLAIQADGKIIAAGYSVTSYDPRLSDMVVLRYNTDLSLDTTFDSDGKQTIHSGDQSGATTVLVQSDGKLLVSGYADAAAGASGDIALVRLTSSGALDTTFSGDGQATTNIGLGSYGGDTAYAAALQPDGKVVVVGSSGDVSGLTLGPWGVYKTDIAVARYLTGSTTTSGKAQVVTGGSASLGNSNGMAQFNAGHACTSGVLTSTKYLTWPGNSQNTGEMPMYWNITTDCAGEYSLNLSLCYTDEELTTSGLVESNLRLYKFVPGSGWQLQGGTPNTNLNCVTLNNVTSLSYWTLAGQAPTAVHVLDLHAKTPAPFVSHTAIAIGLSGMLVFIGVRRSLGHRRA